MMIIAGTVKNAVQMQTLNNNWLHKKESGEILSKKERNERDNWTQEDFLKQHFEEQIAQNREASKRAEIDHKIMEGGTLTPEEVKYLEQQDPSALQKYKQIKAEKRAYEEKLKKCKTKDEVQRLKTETMGQYVASMKKIENNPYIPMSEKLAKAQELLAKVKNVQKAELKFIQSSAYAKLPTEAEEAEKRSEESKEENEEQLEMILDAVEEEKAPEAKEETVLDGEEMPEHGGEEMIEHGIEKIIEHETIEHDGEGMTEQREEEDKPKKRILQDVDFEKEIEDSYRRIGMHAYLQEEGKINVSV